MKKSRLKFLVLLTVILGCITNTVAVKAGYYNLSGLDVQPVVSKESNEKDWFIEYLKPGEEKKRQIQISNRSNKEKHLSLYTTDAFINEEKEFIAKKKEEKENILNKWIQVPVQQFTLKPNETKKIDINFRIPNKISAGFHTGAILVQESAKENSSKPIIFEKGIRVYLNIVGPVIGKKGLNFSFLNQIATLTVILSISGLFIFTFKKIKKNKIPEKVLNFIKRKSFRVSFAYFSLLTISIISMFSFSEFDQKFLKSQILENNNLKTYTLNVKWGNFRKLVLPESYKKEWHGRISLRYGTMKSLNPLHLEKSDDVKLLNNKTNLRFDITTGPDNDGVSFTIEPTSGQIPIIEYENFTTKETFEFKVTDFASSPGIYPDELFAVYFESIIHEPVIIDTDTSLVAEKSATGEAIAKEPNSHITEIEKLFAEELPATPEALAETILTSNYIENIIEEKTKKINKIETDTVLLKALEATPEIISEITATPDVNFVFVPSETITFPPQEFSFDDEKTSQQELGTMIFVQNKDTPWNTYISTTSFKLLSGDTELPASALTIIPGEVKVLTENNGAQIKVGQTKTFRYESDKSTLVNVNPAGDNQEVFVLNPRLEIRIPPGTPAGTYEGLLTITSL